MANGDKMSNTHESSSDANFGMQNRLGQKFGAGYDFSKLTKNNQTSNHQLRRDTSQDDKSIDIPMIGVNLTNIHNDDHDDLIKMRQIREKSFTTHTGNAKSHLARLLLQPKVSEENLFGNVLYPLKRLKMLNNRGAGNGNKLTGNQIIDLKIHDLQQKISDRKNQNSLSRERIMEQTKD